SVQIPKSPIPNEMRVYGVNAVLEALRAGRAASVTISGRADSRLARLIAQAETSGVSVRRVSSAELDRLANKGAHQGVVADLRDQTPSYSVEDLGAGAKATPLLVVLDSIEGPHNVGAILRSADAAGVDGVVRQSRHAARLDGAAAKASAGAVAHMRIAEVVNIARALEDLKQVGVWTVGLAGSGPK